MNKNKIIVMSLVFSLLVNVSLVFYIYKEIENESIKTSNILMHSDKYLEETLLNIYHLIYNWYDLSNEEKNIILTKAQMNLEITALLSWIGDKYGLPFKLYENEIYSSMRMLENNNDEACISHLKKIWNDLGLIDLFYINARVADLSKEEMLSLWEEEKKKLELMK